MIGHGEKLSRKREQALLALLQERTVRKAAQAVGIGEATLGRWMQEPSFRAAYQAASRRLFDETLAELQQASMEAAEALRRNLQCGTPSVELKAADSILQWADRAVELVEFEQRLASLEASSERQDVAR